MSDLSPVEILEGDSPIILGFPHTGTHVPPAYAEKLNAEGRLLRDTDWHIHQLYADLLPGATSVRATFHRYVIDANRDPSGQSLYPGQTTTGLVPEVTFDNVPIRDAPPENMDRRIAEFHAPYHAALQAQIDRIKARHGAAVLYDCHSIRSVIPWLFDGTLPDFNIGTDNGATCAPEIEAAVHRICQASGRTTVLNGRFRGGWTTRHYGAQDNVHAIQMELAQSSHLAREEPPFDLDPGKCAALRPILSEILHSLSDIITKGNAR